MKSTQHKLSRAFTLIELTIAMAIGSILFFGLAFMMGDAQKSWNGLYHEAYSSVISESFVARNTFDHLIRKSSGKKYLMGAANDSIEIYYYNDISSVNTDRYARLSVSGTDLIVEYGTVSDLGPPAITSETSQMTLCSYVSSCRFESSAGAIQMWLELEDGTETLSVMSSAIMQNN